MFRRSLLFVFLIVSSVSGQEQQSDPASLTLDRIFASEEFHSERLAAVKWLTGGGYTTLQPSKAHKSASDIVRYDAAGKSEVLVHAEKLVPPKAKEPLAVQGYELSKDLNLVLIFTNSAKVWRQHTRGDYWIFQRSTGKLKKVGGDAKPATLMFAKLSPDGTSVGYVCGNNVFVESVTGGPATKLTNNGSNEVINGTFD